jgi:hypothetical protein
LGNLEVALLREVASRTTTTTFSFDRDGVGLSSYSRRTNSNISSLARLLSTSKTYPIAVGFERRSSKYKYMAMRIKGVHESYDSSYQRAERRFQDLFAEVFCPLGL